MFLFLTCKVCAIRALWTMSSNPHIFYPVDRISIYWRHLCTRYRKMCSVSLGCAVAMSLSMVPMLRIAPLRLPNSGNTSVHQRKGNEKRKRRLTKCEEKKKIQQTKTENCFLLIVVAMIAQSRSHTRPVRPHPRTLLHLHSFLFIYRRWLRVNCLS